MFCPSNETLQNITEKTKLLAQKCSQQIRVTTISMDSSNGQQVSTFKSYLSENHSDEIRNLDSPLSPTINCLTANLTSFNRLIKERCNAISSYTCNTLPRTRPKRATTKWYIKVSL